jgi:hypothetical protein
MTLKLEALNCRNYAVNQTRNCVKSFSIEHFSRSACRNWGGEPDAGGKLWLVLQESFQW